jgi:mono/diheme cytochrome c family protein
LRNLFAEAYLSGALLCLIAGAAIVPRSAHGQAFAGTDYSGAELFERYCAACHGETGVGDGPVAASLVKVVPDLTRLSERAGGEFPALLVLETIDGRSPVLAHGTRRMPVWGLEFWIEEGGDISAEGRARAMIARLIEHLESIQAE